MDESASMDIASAAMDGFGDSATETFPKADFFIPSASVGKRKRQDSMEALYDSMKKMKTDDEGTKRFLLGLHYMNAHSKAREVTFHAASGDITFGHFL